jgi:hypothetical protein
MLKAVGTRPGMALLDWRQKVEPAAASWLKAAASDLRAAILLLLLGQPVTPGIGPSGYLRARAHTGTLVIFGLTSCPHFFEAKQVKTSLASFAP